MPNYHTVLALQTAILFMCISSFYIFFFCVCILIVVGLYLENRNSCSTVLFELMTIMIY